MCQRQKIHGSVLGDNGNKDLKRSFSEALDSFRNRLRWIFFFVNKIPKSSFLLVNIKVAIFIRL